MRLFEGFDAATDLATALNGLNAGTSATFINANKAQLQDSVVNASSDTFLTNLGSLQQAATTATSTQYYSDQSRNLNNLLGNISVTQGTNLNLANNNSDTATRAKEIKEWYYNNKLDTLFVFQLIFISICALAFIAYLSKIGIIGSYLVGTLIAVIIVIMIFLISNRATYTDMVRDKRYWSKRAYSVPGSLLSGGELVQCPTTTSTTSTSST